MPPKGSSALKQLKQRICNLLPALPCYTFPFFAFIPVITSSQISINCQILRELGWVYSKWCQGCGNHFVAVWCCLRSFPEMQLSCKCRSWCLKSSGKAQIRGVVSGLFSSHITSQRICLHTLFTFGFLLFTPGLIQSFCQAAEKSCQVEQLLLTSGELLSRVKGKESEPFLT